MPPALSDDGASSGDEEIRPRTAKADEIEEVEAEDVEEGSEGGEDQPDEYIVEKILSHRVNKASGILEYNVKWQGYESKKDRTWEPEANLETATEILHEYWEEIGGRPEVKDTKGTKRKARKSGVDSGVATPASNTKRVKKDKEAEWSPPPGSWENDVDYVDTVEESADPKTGDLTRYAYLVWLNEKKTQHPLVHVYQKCPQKMLKYYESHLVFTHSPDEDLNGDKDTLMKGGEL